MYRENQDEEEEPEGVKNFSNQLAEEIIKAKMEAD